MYVVVANPIREVVEVISEMYIITMVGSKWRPAASTSTTADVAVEEDVEIGWAALVFETGMDMIVGLGVFVSKGVGTGVFVSIRIGVPAAKAIDV